MRRYHGNSHQIKANVLTAQHRTYHQLRETGVQFLRRRHGGAELQQLERHAVLQVDLGGLTAAEAAQEAQARARPFPRGHSGDARRGWGLGQGGGVERKLLSGGHDLRRERESEREQERRRVR